LVSTYVAVDYVHKTDKDAPYTAFPYTKITLSKQSQL
jgi:hypothetical protein